jgi:hypothetical protein
MFRLRTYDLRIDQPLQDILVDKMLHKLNHRDENAYEKQFGTLFLPSGGERYAGRDAGNLCDVNLLVRTFETEFGHIEGQKWQFGVLKNWYSYRDGANKDESGYRVYSAASTSPLCSQSKPSTWSPHP